MTTIKDLKGFCYPLTPGGTSSLVGEMPWHYATEYLSIAYRTDPAAVAAYLPEPLEPAQNPISPMWRSVSGGHSGTTSRTWRSLTPSARNIFSTEGDEYSSQGAKALPPL